MTDVDADALNDLVRQANLLPYLLYGLPHDLSILEKISRYYLRHHPGIVGAYANVKKALALVFGEDIAGYRNAKHPFIQQVMAKAQAERDAATAP